MKYPNKETPHDHEIDSLFNGNKSFWYHNTYNFIEIKNYSSQFSIWGGGGGDFKVKFP